MTGQRLFDLGLGLNKKSSIQGEIVRLEADVVEEEGVAEEGVEEAGAVDVREEEVADPAPTSNVSCILCVG